MGELLQLSFRKCWFERRIGACSADESWAGQLKQTR